MSVLHSFLLFLVKADIRKTGQEVREVNLAQQVTEINIVFAPGKYDKQQTSIDYTKLGNSIMFLCLNYHNCFDSQIK